MSDSISRTLTECIRKGDLASFVATATSDRKFSVRLLHTDFSLPTDPELTCLPKSQLSLLHLAAFFDMLEIYLFLVRQGMSLDIKSGAGFLPIHYAAGGRSVEVALAICGSGSATISAEGPNHVTPLFLASSLNCTEITRALLEANVEVNLTESNPVRNFIRHRNGEMLSLIFQRASASLRSTSRFMSPLMIAITERYPEAVPLLLQEGADVNYTTPDRKTALYYACFLNQPDVVKQMLDAGVNLGFHDGDRQYPLHWAAGSGNVDIVQMIVKAGGYPFDLDAHGRYAWMCAIGCSGKGRYDVIKYLLDLGQPPGWKLRDGTVPFVDLLVKDDPELIQLFLDHGLDLNITHQNRTLLEIADQIGSKANSAVIHRFLNKTGT